MIERAQQIYADGVVLDGDLTLPTQAQGLVVFAHGSGSSRFSPRNRFVAHGLNDGGLATLLLDLLTRDEEQYDLRTTALRFNIGLLADRLARVVVWTLSERDTRRLKVGLFGSSTGAAAALCAAAQSKDVSSVVSRGGRPDLAGDDLERVRAPTLLIVGGRDLTVMALNQQALGRLRCPKELRIVSDATHLFEEPGALEEVTALSRAWFQCTLRPAEEQERWPAPPAP